MAVQSSSVGEIGYNPVEQKLEVQFRSGKVYQYFGVPQTAFLAFIASESEGRFFNEQIRDVYQHVQIFP